MTPFGQIVAVPARGTLMGNRGGCLHDDHGRLGRARWRSRAWIYCLLDFRERRRTIMSPGRYTELFFLDESTALAAGHRPCGECQRNRLAEFKAAWRSARLAAGLEIEVSLAAIDRLLHAERTSGRADGRRARPAVVGLTDGVFVSLAEQPEVAWLVWHGALWRWSPDGYRESQPIDPARAVQILTPSATAQTIAAGFRPSVHQSVHHARSAVGC